MTNLPSRPANRLRKPSWRDSRLLAGVLLVLACAVAGSVVVARADDRVPVYAAATVLVPGEALSPDKLTRVDVQLGAGMAGYLAADLALPSPAYVLREVRPGELLPRSAVGGLADVGLQPVTLDVDATSASTLVRGSVVDVYVNPPKPGTNDEYAGPQLALRAVAVATGPTAKTGFARSGAQTTPISVMVPKSKVAVLVGRIDDGSRITVVPVPGTVTRGRS